MLITQLNVRKISENTTEIMTYFSSWVYGGMRNIYYTAEQNFEINRL